MRGGHTSRFVPFIASAHRAHHAAKRNLRRVTIVGAALATVLSGGAAMSVAGTASATTSATPTPPFTQCPAVGADTSCRLLVNFAANGNPAILTDSTQAASFSSTDNTLVGVQNNSAFAIGAIEVSSATAAAAFAFDGDGACATATTPKPSACPYDTTGYAGPGVGFSQMSADHGTGTVTFSPAIAPGASAWFSLEGAQGASTITVSARAGSFGCRASAARVAGSVEPEVANANTNPCADGNGSIPAVGPLSLLDAATTLNEGVLPASGDAATAAASLASLVSATNGNVIDVEGATSSAAVGCVEQGGKLTPAFTSASSVASLDVNGQSYSGNQSQSQTSGALTVYINRTIFDSTTSTLTQRAVEIDLNGSELLVAGESIVNLAGSPCTSVSTVLPVGSCEPTSSLTVLVNGSNVIAYIPKAYWLNNTSTGVSVVNVEGTSITPKKVPTRSAVNSCSSNPLTGVTVCTANDSDVYELKGTSLKATLTSSGSGSISFSGGSCTNCGIAMDATHNRAVIGLSIGGKPGFQILDLGTSKFEPAFASAAGEISEDPLLDPTRNLLLSASEGNNYEIVNLSKSTSPKFFENGSIPVSGVLDSSAEDCSTGIALAPAEGSSPSNVFIADLTKAKFTPGTPAGTWTAPSQVQKLSESNLSAGASGIAVAQGTGIGIISGEFGGDSITALKLPTSSGTGKPAISDWVSCAIGSGFSMGYDPHTLTAYRSPNDGHAYALLANDDASKVVKVDLTKMLDSSVVGRTTARHGCKSTTLPSSVERFITVP